MKYKKYKLYKLLIVLLLAGTVSAFVTAGNFIIPLIAFLIAVVLMFVLNRSVNEVLTDERINKIAGKAAKITMTVSVLIMALAGLVLIALRETYPQYLITGYVLAYLGCGMLFLYTILFKYYSREKI